MKENNIKQNYQRQHTITETKAKQDYLNNRIFETLLNFFSLILKRRFVGKILDLGCGDGSFVRYCHKRGLDAVGIDINDSVNFEYDRLPYSDNQFDIVYLYSVIEHISDPSNILKEIKRVLTNSGVVIMITPNFDYNVKAFYDDPTHVKPYNPRNLEYLMKLFNYKKEFIGLWTVKKTHLIWKLSQRLQFIVGRLIPFPGKNRYVPAFLKGRSTTIIGAFSPGDAKREDEKEIEAPKAGVDMHNLIRKLYPICRSITGNGNRQSLKIIKEHIPLEVHEVPTGTKAFDWTVPREWNITDAYIKNSQGEKIIDFSASNLHVLNYSIPVNKKMTLLELKPHLHTLPEYPDWIPYLTSYYNENWGFCLSHRQYKELKEDTYEVVIKSSLKDGSLTYGELFISGQSDKEILISTYICHPSLANDNLSGVALSTFLAKRLLSIRDDLEYSYRFLFVPETIGSITWLSQNQNKIKNIKHGLVATCVGDLAGFTYKKSRQGDAEIDKVAEYVLKQSGVSYKTLDFFPSGSDECQYCSPGFNLPVGSLIRSLYGEFNQYHTSADDLSLVKPEALAESLDKYQNILNILENNKTYLNLNPKCEPQLGRRGLYRLIGAQKGSVDIMDILWVLNLSDGDNSLLDIALRSKISFRQIKEAADLLLIKGLLKMIKL